MLKPLHDQVLISPIEQSNKTEGGLYRPENAKEKPTKGVVVAVGPGLRDRNGKRVELDVKKGDTVLYPKFSGTEIQLSGEPAIMLNESAILAVIEDDVQG